MLDDGSEWCLGVRLAVRLVDAPHRFAELATHDHELPLVSAGCVRQHFVHQVLETVRAAENAREEDEPVRLSLPQNDHGPDSGKEEAGRMVRESWVQRYREHEMLEPEMAT